MKTWFTSDLHFGHNGIIEYCNRPFADVFEMDQALAYYWNSIVSDEDEVYVLGDVSFHRPAIGVPLIKSLKGKKFLVRGNHDKYSLTQYHDAGFLCVGDEIVLTSRGQRFRLSHYPYDHRPMQTESGWKESQGDDRYFDRRPPRFEGEWLLCGHVHEKWQVLKNQINVGVDQWNYRPVSAGQIESIISKRGIHD